MKTEAGSLGWGESKYGYSIGRTDMLALLFHPQLTRKKINLLEGWRPDMINNSSYHQYRLGRLSRIPQTEDEQRSQKTEEGDGGNVSYV